ncbi:uncharacterized protein TRIVIDRAFT_64469 [Trichoderma virens Gv29-8]|uniref:Uncharacterized protein n=1 Tax=Hypocrea virens (strain Gv29-8 / FGSC 10586) TaxID=413071 RepID=G9ND73_HYPVG|nr:uncharacterized protein TRIVIDRAFT_64469 [Trichoderma virens Gv29-8]EHK15642.1 hypothetical protein TRIVIDRAFT_64469 [Trichoderma virens Gv29-8]UKZ51586.1 hypothetical protein TrVGV298_005347 [Trichoderma virens]
MTSKLKGSGDCFCSCLCYSSLKNSRILASRIFHSMPSPNRAAYRSSTRTRRKSLSARHGRVAALVHAACSYSTDEEQLADQDDPAAPPRNRRPSILPGQIIDLAQRTPLLAASKRTSPNARPRASSDKRDGWKAAGWLTPPHGQGGWLVNECPARAVSTGLPWL